VSSSAEILYTFRTVGCDVLQRARTQTVQMEAYRDGALVAPSAGTFTLVDPSGTALVDAQAVTIASSIARYTIDATAIPATLELGEDYQERWSLVMPDGSTRTILREAAIARFLLHPVVADVDLTSEYPDLVAEFATVATSLQGFLDEAWRQICEKLFQRDRWPDLLISTSALRLPHRELALYLAHKALYRSAPSVNRWETLMQLHQAGWEREWGALTAKWDRDLDGLADGGREAVNGVVHRHVGPRANRPLLGTRWRSLC
jgi:hypothetical protein